MEIFQFILVPQALGWVAALLTLLTFISADMRRLRLLALAANAAFIGYGQMAQVLPVMVLHLALVPVNLWRLNQAFSRRDRTPARPQAPVLRTGRQPSGWTGGRRGVRVGRRQTRKATTSEQPAPGPQTGSHSTPVCHAAAAPWRRAAG